MKLEFSRWINLEDFLILQSLGVAHRVKKDSHVFWVNPATGSDTGNLSGSSFRSPVATMAKAIGKCETTRGDFVVLQSSIVQAAEEDISIAKADLTLVGMMDPFGYYGIKSDAAVAATVLSLTAAAANVLIKRLYLDNAAGLRSIIKTASECHFLRVEDCVFNVKGAASADIGYGINLSAAAVNSPVVLRNTFYVQTLVQDVMQIKAGLTGGLIAENTIVNMLDAGGTGAVNGINLAAGTGVVIRSNHISGGEVITARNFDTVITIAAGCINTILTGPNYIGNCDAGVTDGGDNSCGETAGEGWVNITHA